jgi:hypothetical protein
LWAIEFVYKRKLEDIFLPALYVLINLAQTLSEYIFSSDTQYKVKSKELLFEVNKWLSTFKQLPAASNILSQNLQLSLFTATQQQRINHIFEVKDNIKIPTIIEMPKVKMENTLRILTSLFYLDKDLFIQFFEAEFSNIINDINRSRDGLNNFLFLQCLTLYCSLTAKFDSIDLSLNPITKSKIDVENSLGSIFSNYAVSQKEKISNDELTLLLGYNDAVLRTKLANTIVGVDKQILDRESRKPHGVFEIADMELRIQLNNERFFLCMPFKSGIEIRNPTVPESIAYQIFRPFIHFDNAIVIFVTAKRCSQNLLNYIKRMQDKLGWGIAVLENEELAKLLKANGQLN